MSTLGKAVILFGADTALFRGDVGKAVAIFEGGINSMTRAALGFKGAITSALSVGGAVAFTQHVIDLADELGKLHEKTGRSVENLSELKLAYELGGGAADQFSLGLREWNKRLIEATDGSSKTSRVMKALGVDIKAGPTESFRQFADAFARLPEDMRASVASDLLKKGAEGWVAVLAKGSAGFDAAADKARALGLVISDDFAKQAETFNSNMRLLQQASVGFANVILRDTLPVLTEWSAVMAKAAERGGTLAGVMQGLRYLNARTGAALSPDDPLFKEKLDRVRTQMVEPGALHSGQLSSGRIKGFNDYVGDLPLATDRAAPDPEALRKALAETEALYKRQAAAIQAMEEKKRSLFDLDEQELMILRVTTGSYKDFDSDTKVRLLNMALDIDLRHQLIAVMDSELEHAKALDAGREQGNQIFKDFLLAGKANLDQRDFEVSLLGKTALQQERLNALHEIDLRLLAAKRAAAAAYGEDFAGAAKEQARLEDEAQRQRVVAIEQIKQRQQVEREWATGARQAFLEYSDASTNAAAQAQMLWTDAFRGSEDALVDFVKNGKLNFSNLADSIIADLTRIAARRAILGPIADWLMAGSSGFAGPLATLGAMFGGGGDFGGADIGGVGAAPYAAGGRPRVGELAIVGERGPELFVPDVAGTIVPNAALRGMRGGGGDRPVNVNVNIQTPDPASFRASSAQIAQDLAAGVRRGLR
jgi:lambda family phage tail tape measure protein